MPSDPTPSVPVGEPTWREWMILQWLIGSGRTADIDPATIAAYYARFRPYAKPGSATWYGYFGPATTMFRRFEAKGWIRNGELTKAGKRAANV